MEYEMNQFVGVYDNLLCPDICNGILQFADKKKNEDPNLDCIDNPGVRTDISIYPHKYGSYQRNFQKEVDSSLREAYKMYCDEYNDLMPNNTPVDIFTHFSTSHHTDYKLQISQPPQTGFNAWHWEQCQGRRNDSRFAVWMIYLNSLKDSGHTEFLFQNIKLLPTQGTVVIWPAAYTHLHRSSPILNQPKYILTGWFRYR